MCLSDLFCFLALAFSGFLGVLFLVWCSSCGWVWWFSCAYVDCSALGILGCVRWRSRISIVCCDRVFVRVGLLVL